MSVTIPLGDFPTAGADGGVKIPLGFISRTDSSRRETSLALAVAAAAAVKRPGEVLRIVGDEQDNPGSIAAAEIDAGLTPVLEAVSRRIKEPRGAPPPASAAQIAAARAVRVDPTLVAVAAAELEGRPEAVLTSALYLGASVEPTRLAEAARAGLRRTRLELVPDSETGRADRAAAVEARVKVLEDLDLKDRLADLEQRAERVIELEERVRSLEEEQLPNRVATLEQRVLGEEQLS